MSLDITAYRNLRPDPAAKLDSDGYPIVPETHWNPGGLLTQTESIWPGRTRGLVEDCVYQHGKDDTIDFRAGSYSGYNRWREQLAVLAGYISVRGIWEEGNSLQGPFVELLNFSDCEGVIGPVVSAKLANDFAEHEAEILGKAPDDYFREKYRCFRKAFEMAADNGAVRFH